MMKKKKKTFSVLASSDPSVNARLFDIVFSLQEGVTEALGICR